MPILDNNEYSDMMNTASNDEPTHHTGVKYQSCFNLRSDAVHQTVLEDSIFLRLEKMSRGIGRICFVDESNTEVEIPSSIAVHDDTNRIPLKPAPGTQYFALSWMIDYSVHFKGEVMLVLSSQQQWALRCPPERTIDTFES
jgi:hypothetical protein